MSLVNISSFFWSEQSRADIVRIQKDLQDVQRETSSGRKVDELADVGANAMPVLTSRAALAAAAAREEAARALESRLSVQDLALGEMAGAVGDLRTAVMEAIAARASTGLDTTLNNTFTRLAGALNTTFSGQYVFGGERTDEAPLRAASMAQIEADPGGGQWFTDPRRSQTFDFGDGVTADVSARGAQLGRPALEAMMQLKGLMDRVAGANRTLTQPEIEELRAVVGALEPAHDNLLEAQGQNGEMQRRIENEVVRLDERKALFEKAVGDRVDANLAETALRLAQLRTQFQAAAQVFNEVRELTLLNFLR